MYDLPNQIAGAVRAIAENPVLLAVPLAAIAGVVTIARRK